MDEELTDNFKQKFLKEATHQDRIDRKIMLRNRYQNATSFQSGNKRCCFVPNIEDIDKAKARLLSPKEIQ